MNNKGNVKGDMPKALKRYILLFLIAIGFRSLKKHIKNDPYFNEWEKGK